jgi:hypothetical protein
VEDDLGPMVGEGAIEEVRIGDRSLDERRSRSQRLGQVLSPSRGEVIEGEHLVPAPDQRIDQMGADEPGAPRNQSSHRGGSVIDRRPP